MLSVITVGAQGFYYYENEDGTLTITHSKERWHGPEGNQHFGTCHSYTGNIMIPEEIDGKKVTAIGKDAFFRCDITSVILSNTLKLIEDEAFLECPNVKELTIPASVDSIGKHAFSGWNALEQVTIEDSPNVLHVGHGGSSVMSSMFSDQPLLKKAYVGRNHICPIVGASMDYEINLFARSHVEEITFGYYVTEIQKHELLGCASLKKVTLGDKITRIGIDAFTGCSILEDINLPARLEKIDTRAFRRCYALKDPKFPTSLKEIGEEAYGECSIENIHIPASVEKIYYNAFGGTKLGDIYCYGTVPPVCTDWLFHNISKDKMTLHYPKGSRDDYKAAVCWKEFFDDYAVEFDDAYVDPNSGGEGTGDGTEFIVHLKAGGTVGYALVSKPKVTLSGNVFTVTTTDGAATYQHSEVRNSRSMWQQPLASLLLKQQVSRRLFVR